LKPRHQSVKSTQIAPSLRTRRLSVAMHTFKLAPMPSMHNTAPL
jgi:hypothetical protein